MYNLKKGDKLFCHTVCIIQDFKNSISSTTVGKIYSIIDIESEKYNNQLIYKLKIINDYGYDHFFYVHTYHKFFIQLKEMRKDKINQINKTNNL